MLISNTNLPTYPSADNEADNDSSSVWEPKDLLFQRLLTVFDYEPFQLLHKTLYYIIVYWSNSFQEISS